MPKKPKVVKTIKVEGANIDDVMIELEAALRTMIADEEQKIDSFNNAILDAKDKRDDIKAKADIDCEDETSHLEAKRDEAKEKLNHLRELLARVDP